MESLQRSTYQPLNVEPELQTNTISRKSRQLNPTESGTGRRRVFWIFIVGTTLLALIISAVAYRRWSSTKLTNRVMASPCGHTPGDAKAAGCTFDVMMDEWLPQSCYDKELSEEFIRIRDWQFYSDKNRTRELSVEELSHSRIAWTTGEYHVAHCSFALRKLHRAILHGRQIEKQVADEAHTTHCAEMLRNLVGSLEIMYQGVEIPANPSIQDVVTRLRPGYPLCIDAKTFVMY